jgi:hypothetical protein
MAGVPCGVVVLDVQNDGRLAAHGKSKRWLLTVSNGTEPLVTALGLADLLGGVGGREAGGEEVRGAGQAQVQL